MIKNEKQYKITRNKLGDIKSKIAEMKAREQPLPVGKQLIMASLMQMDIEMQKEVDDYEFLKMNKSNILKSRSISELPSLITEYKIISGLTQKEFSLKIGLKEQQLQRYEAESFKSISFKNLLKILQVIGLNVQIKDTRIEKSTKNRSGRNKSVT